MRKGYMPCAEHPEHAQPHSCVQQPNTAINLERTKQVLGGMEQIPSTSKSEKSHLTLIFYPPHTGYFENSDSCTACGPV